MKMICPFMKEGKGIKSLNAVKKSLNFLQKELQCFKTLLKSASIALENLQNNHQITAVTQDTQENTNALKNTTQDFNKLPMNQQTLTITMEWILNHP